MADSEVFNIHFAEYNGRCAQGTENASNVWRVNRKHQRTLKKLQKLLPLSVMPQVCTRHQKWTFWGIHWSWSGSHWETPVQTPPPSSPQYCWGVSPYTPPWCWHSSPSLFTNRAVPTDESQPGGYQLASYPFCGIWKSRKNWMSQQLWDTPQRQISFIKQF